MAFSILRACSRLTHMGFVERNTGVVAATIFGNMQQPENVMVSWHLSCLKFFN